MNKNFLKSVITGVVSLGLIASCSQLTGKKDSHNCSSNKCSAKKADEANKCSAKKTEESNKCSSKKAETNKCSSKKAAEVKTDAKAKKSTK